jgi:hypothetical protein
MLRPIFPPRHLLGILAGWHLSPWELHPMHRSFHLVIACSFLAIVAGLVRGDDKVPPTPYFPLAVGTTWSYKAGENRFQLKVAEVKTVAGSARAKLELIVAGKVISHEQVGVTKDGVVRYTFEGKEAKPPIDFLRLPPKTGATWKVDSKVDGQSLRGTFKAGEAEVKVPAGSYKTVTSSGQDIDANGVRMSLTYYFAEKVGMVKQEIDLAGQKILIELEKYEPGK